MYKNVKTIFIDYDGTLHQSLKIYAPAFIKAYEYLVSIGKATPKTWENEEISQFLGLNSQEMWQQFMPDLDDVIRDRASKMIGSEMLKSIKNGESVLYDHALEILEYLKKRGYHIVFLSNCSIKYRDLSRDYFELDKYFDEMLCSEEYNNIPKYEILKRVKNQYPKNEIVIGDRYQDIEAGVKNNLKTIGCSYGYSRKGELREADSIINKIEELRDLL